MKDIEFTIEKVYDSDRIYRTFGVNTTRGIKYTGTANSPGYIVIMLNLDSWSKSNPYHDRLKNDYLYCTGEGLEEKQKLIGGNLALSRSLVKPCSIYVFNKLDIDEYKYLGQAKLDSITEELQYDKKERLRKVFVFKLKLEEYNLYNKLDNKEIMTKDILNFEETSQLLGVSTRTLTEILKSNQVPGRKLGRQWHFSRRHLIEWLGSGISETEY